MLHIHHLNNEERSRSHKELPEITLEIIKLISGGQSSLSLKGKGSLNAGMECRVNGRNRECKVEVSVQYDW